MPAAIDGNPALAYKFYGNNASWIKKTFTFVVPTSSGLTEESKHYLAFYIQHCTTGKAYVDDVSVSIVDNLFPNGDFESFTGDGFTGMVSNNGVRGTNFFVDSLNLPKIGHD